MRIRRFSYLLHQKNTGVGSGVEGVGGEHCSRQRVELVDQIADGVRGGVEVDAGRVGVLTHRVKLVAILYRQLGKQGKITLLNIGRN